MDTDSDWRRDHFCAAVEAWHQRGHLSDWLRQENAVLQYAQAVGCRFDQSGKQDAHQTPDSSQVDPRTRSDLEVLSRWESADHVAAARALLTSDKRSDPLPAEWQVTQATQLMTGLIHAVRAASALAEFPLDLDHFREAESLPEEFVHRAAACLKSYHTAWPLLTQTLFADRNAVGTATSASLTKHSPPGSRCNCWPGILTSRHMTSSRRPAR